MGGDGVQCFGLRSCGCMDEASFSATPCWRMLRLLPEVAEAEASAVTLGKQVAEMAEMATERTQVERVGGGGQVLDRHGAVGLATSARAASDVSVRLASVRPWPLNVERCWREQRPCYMRVSPFARGAPRLLKLVNMPMKLALRLRGSMFEFCGLPWLSELCQPHKSARVGAYAIKMDRGCSLCCCRRLRTAKMRA